MTKSTLYHFGLNVKPQLTFAQLADLEPQLKALLETAQAVNGRARTFCANTIWYRQFKPQIVQLVGWHAHGAADSRLRSAAAYDLAYKTIYKALPDCRECGCIPMPVAVGR